MMEPCWLFLISSLLWSTENVFARQCIPSVTLYLGDQEITITEEVRDLEWNNTVHNAMLDGCGECYTLYEKKGGEGESTFLPKDGEHNILLATVRSVQRRSCTTTLAIIIIIVLVFLIIVLPLCVASCLLWYGGFSFFI